MPEVWFHYLEGMAGCANYLFLYVLLHVTPQDLIPCTPPTGQPTCVCESNKGTINFTSIGNNINVMVHQHKC